MGGGGSSQRANGKEIMGVESAREREYSKLAYVFLFTYLSLTRDANF